MLGTLFILFCSLNLKKNIMDLETIQKIVSHVIMAEATLARKTDGGTTEACEIIRKV